MKPILIIAFLLFASGCADTIHMKHPATGATAICSYWAPVDSHRCINDFQRQGYERVTG